MKAISRRSLALCLFCICATAAAVYATSVVIPTDEELVIGARAIVRGQVTNVASSYDEAHKGIFTYVTVQVADVYKGALLPGTITLKEPGGVTRTQGSVIYGTPTFTVGEEVLLYLDSFLVGELKPGQALSRDLVERWIQSMSHLSPNTRINRLCVLRRFCRYLSHFDRRTCIIHRGFLPRRTRPWARPSAWA